MNYNIILAHLNGQLHMHSHDAAVFAIILIISVAVAVLHGRRQ